MYVEFFHGNYSRRFEWIYKPWAKSPFSWEAECGLQLAAWRWSCSGTGGSHGEALLTGAAGQQGPALGRGVGAIGAPQGIWGTLLTYCWGWPWRESPCETRGLTVTGWWLQDGLDAHPAQELSWNPPHASLRCRAEGFLLQGARQVQDGAAPVVYPSCRDVSEPGFKQDRGEREFCNIKLASVHQVNCTISISELKQCISEVI